MQILDTKEEIEKHLNELKSNVKNKNIFEQIIELQNREK